MAAPQPVAAAPPRPTGNAHKKKPSAHGRPARPAALTRRDTAGRPGTGKSSKRSSRDLQHSRASSQDLDEDIMTLGFHQYCTVCEAQIASPNAAVLYCSESCRQKDTAASPSFSVFMRDAISPPSSGLDPSDLIDHSPILDLIPQRSPTIHTQHHKFFAKADDDTSHQRSGSSSSTRSRSPNKRPGFDSDAALYLRQFQSSAPTYTRPKTQRTSTNNIPSLSSTPTSSASSSMPFTPLSDAYRPLPPRTQRRGTSASWYGGPIDLVTPVAVCPAASTSLQPAVSSAPYSELAKVSSVGSEETIRINVEQADGQACSYEKKDILGQGVSPARSSLQKLFRAGDPRAAPEA